MWIEKVKIVMSQAFQFLLPFMRILATQSGKILIVAAQEAVLAVATNMQGKTGAEKRDAAFAMISQKLISAGVPMATAVINSALEAAVVKLKELE